MRIESKGHIYRDYGVNIREGVNLEGTAGHLQSKTSKWGNGLVFKGYLQRKLRKNFEVRIPKELNKHWCYPNELASVPADVMRRITLEEQKTLLQQQVEEMDR